MPKTLLTSSRYQKFTSQRNAALEQIHQHAQIDLSRITFAMLEQIEHLAASLALKAGTAYMTHQVSTQFETGVRDVMTATFPNLVKRILSLRKAAFILAYAGEQEAIGRATQRDAVISRGHFQKRIKDEMAAPTLLGPLDKRVWLGLMNLRRRICQAFEIAVTQELPPIEIVAKVTDSFPIAQVYKRPPKALSKVRESADNPDDTEDKEDWFDFQFIDDGDWNLMVEQYKDTELPPNRFDNTLPSFTAEQGYNWMSKYNWEIEQETTEDFVRSVMAGKVDGADDLGVQDFVWIAILDDKTDDCCEVRNGKTTTEIEELDDDCDAIVPPAHFNCRCDIGPVASTDEVSGPQWSDFSEWLARA